ncbi:MAG: AtzE family amidohydrolase [Acetobacteraceae bacterium]|jgi:aspartyl-tRNA(Asn)/glutamyl-tRNA(Gln) amidotransferase subunit A|nr:AtzE family amidohydrolase [Acetobacteraceae bacterium]
MSAEALLDGDAAAIAAAVRAQKVTAESVAEAALARIAARNATLNAFTDVTAARALASARRIDAMVARGDDPGPLAGVPYAAKNLFDIAGLPTRAGSKIGRDNPPAVRDATAIARLDAAGAVLVGGLNMGEYAYDFTGENAHDGPSRNPHDTTRMAGGSSGGSGAAVGGRLVPLALGTDTNGSIRVPAAFCGVFGLKPTYGRLSRAGAMLFAGSFDHIGPLARSVRDLAAAYDAMLGADADDPAQAATPAVPLTGRLPEASSLRIAVAGGHFRQNAAPGIIATVDAAAASLGAVGEVTIPEAARARAAAFVITTVEGGNLHLPRLRTRPMDFDPATRDRFLAGALLPAGWYLAAQRFRAWYRRQVLALFEAVDVILAPATPLPAPLIGQQTMTLNGGTVPLRPNIGLYTQPLSFIGLPVVCAPCGLSPEGLPLGVQIIAAPWREEAALAVASALERSGIARCPEPRP